MQPRARVTTLVAVVAVLAATVAAGVASLTADHPPRPKPRPGAPPLVLDLGVRADREATALRRAEGLYARGRRAEAGRVFGRYRSLQALVGSAFAAWPDGLDEIAKIAREHPRSALVRLHEGLALFWSGRSEQAVTAWRSALQAQPDTASALRAEDFLFPDLPPGRPIFVPGVAPPAELARLPPAAQLRALASRAATGGPTDRLLYGVAQQRLGRSVSAERLFARAAAEAPNDAEAQVAAAVGRFTKADPSRAFGRLGPLTRRFPDAPTVRFHLGLTLFWLRRPAEATRQLRLARAEAPGSPLGREANRFLLALKGSGTR